MYRDTSYVTKTFNDGQWNLSQMHFIPLLNFVELFQRFAGIIHVGPIILLKFC